MNHCIPGRKLMPDNVPIQNGLIVTPPMTGNYTHYVFRDKDTPLFKMPKKLFVCHDRSRMKNTEVIRREKTLEFGDSIVFTTAHDYSNIVLDYEKSLQVHEADCNYGKFLVKSVCILPPIEKDPLRCWSELFGWMDLSRDKSIELHQLAEPDVPIYSWVSIEIQPGAANPDEQWIKADFYEFVEIALDERKIAWDTDWNKENPNRRPTGSTYKWTHTDDEDEEDELDFIEKKEDQILDVKLRLEGVLIGEKELYCKDLKEHRVYIGLWKEKHMCKPDNLPLGWRCNFDAYYNDIHGVYIAYFYEFGENDTEDYVCDVWLAENDTHPTVIGVTIFPSETWGSLYKTYFGLVSDKRRILGTLPYMFTHEAMLEADEEERGEEEETINGNDEEERVEEEFTGEVMIYIEDTGPARNKLCRFVCHKELPEATRKRVDKANHLATNETIKTEGFIYNLYFRYVFAPKYPTQRFVFPAEHIRDYPVGYWLNFEAAYRPEKREHEIIGGKLDTTKNIVPNSKITTVKDKVSTHRYQFKIEVELSQVEFAKDHLFNPMYGFIADPDQKFLPSKRTKKFKVIITEDKRAEAVTHFKLERMAEKNEQMKNERKPKNMDIPYNDDECAVDDYEDESDNDIGLDSDDLEEEENLLSQVDYLQEYAIRTRKLRARERKRERDKAEKQMLEAQRVQEQTMKDDEGERQRTEGTEQNTESRVLIPSTSTAIAKACRNYSIPEVDKLKAKFIAGRIIPAIATATAMATGFVCLELYKVLSGNHKVESYRNTFANLALPLFSMAEPVPPKVIKHQDLTWTVWDRWILRDNPTLRELLQWLKNKGLNAYSISYGSCLLFNSMFPRHKDRMDKKMVNLAKEVAKADLPSYRKHFDVVVACEDDEDNDVDIPQISIYFR